MMILCCGEALIDMLPRTLPDGAHVFAPTAGGAVFNTAIAIDRLGLPAGFNSGLSSDLFGDQLREALVTSRVNISHTVTVDRPTTLAFVTLVDGQARYDFYDENTAGRLLDQGDLPALGDEVEMLFFGGISLIGEPCGSAYQFLAMREAKNRVIMLDPNIRPGLVSDEAAYRSRLESMFVVADIVKQSHEDLAWLRGKGDAAAHAQALLDAGPSLVIVTRGSGLATAYTNRHRVDVGSVPVDAVDTIGAGDTFDAGVLAVLNERSVRSKSAIKNLAEDDLEALLKLGSAVAAMTVSRAGANPPWRSELASFEESPQTP
jgi:fructokinase